LLERHGFNVEDVRRANMLPLNISGHLLRNRGTNVIWGLNRFLSAIPVVNTIATNVDVVARVGSSDPNDQRESGTRIVRWS
jgi:nucleoside diphosphate kinase